MSLKKPVDDPNVNGKYRKYACIAIPLLFNDITDPDLGDIQPIF